MQKRRRHQRPSSERPATAAAADTTRASSCLLMCASWAGCMGGFQEGSAPPVALRRACCVLRCASTATTAKARAAVQPFATRTLTLPIPFRRSRDDAICRNQRHGTTARSAGSVGPGVRSRLRDLQQSDQRSRDRRMDTIHQRESLVGTHCFIYKAQRVVRVLERDATCARGDRAARRRRRLHEAKQRAPPQLTPLQCSSFSTRA